jgi:uncharacterized protein YbaR (Trm112 family)
MHILLTDQLVCPRCGPAFGLILLADQMEDRRVLEGRLGCANCREEYAVLNGMADLRFPAGAPLTAVAPAASDSDDATRLAALLGVAEGVSPVLIAGPAAAHAPVIASLVDHLEVVAVDPNLAAQPEQPGVSRFASRAVLPFRSRSMRAVALTGESTSLLDEAVRVLSPAGRLVVEAADSAVVEQVRSAGLTVLLEQDGVVVASTASAG